MVFKYILSIGMKFATLELLIKTRPHFLVLDCVNCDFLWNYTIPNNARKQGVCFLKKIINYLETELCLLNN